MGRKNKNSRFNTSVPCFIQEVHRGLDVFLTSPLLPQPWPDDLPSILHLHFQILGLEEAEQVMQEHKESDLEMMKKITARDEARRVLKNLVACVLRHVELTVRGRVDLDTWPGFDQRRIPLPSLEFDGDGGIRPFKRNRRKGD